jgi:hypothetical protein
MKSMAPVCMTDNLLITGIPRSGTSYACALLNSIVNTVIVNEPDEIFQILKRGSDHTMKSFYDYTRQRINSGLPIQNKIVNGKYIEDTNDGDFRSLYKPEVSDASFVLGTKNTLIYLATLHKLREQLPEAKIVAFVRHPFDCIASWKRVKFPHIRSASPLFLNDYVDAPLSDELVRICQTPELATRYALLWNFLGMRIISCADELTLFRYEDFAAQPEQQLADLYRSMGKNVLFKSAVVPSQARKHEGKLSDLEQDRIRRYCGATAAHFGYAL